MKKKLKTGVIENGIDPATGLIHPDLRGHRAKDDNDVDDWLYCKVVIHFERWLLLQEDAVKRNPEAYIFWLKSHEKLKNLVQDGPLNPSVDMKPKRYF